MSVMTTKLIRHAVILTHPDERSFNSAVAAAYCEIVRQNGQEFILRDLYRMRFNPVLRKRERPGSPNFKIFPDVRAELELLEGTDVFTFVYPIWFGMPPAMTKGYVDRVIGSGVTVTQVQQGLAGGPLRGAHLFCITTSGTRQDWLLEQGQISALRDVSSHYLFRAFAMRFAQTMHIGCIADGLSPHVVDLHLDEVRERARRICAALAEERYGTARALGVADGS